MTAAGRLPLVDPLIEPEGRATMDDERDNCPRTGVCEARWVDILTLSPDLVISTISESSLSLAKPFCLDIG